MGGWGGEIGVKHLAASSSAAILILSASASSSLSKSLSGVSSRTSGVPASAAARSSARVGESDLRCLSPGVGCPLSQAPDRVGAAKLAKLWAANCAPNAAAAMVGRAPPRGYRCSFPVALKQRGYLLHLLAATNPAVNAYDLQNEP